MKILTDDQKKRHSACQQRYHDKKLATHQKRCVWVPNDEVESFYKAVANMKKKWEKKSCAR